MMTTALGPGPIRVSQEKRVSDIDRNLPATLHDIRSVTARQAPNMSKTLAKNIAPL